MDKLNALGIGPKIGAVALPWLALSIFFSARFKSSFQFSVDENRILFFTGLVMLVAGVAMYFLTVLVLLKGLKETKLITRRGYYLCRNPLYASILLFIVPGISLMMNSWLVLTTTLAGFVMFKIFIKNESEEMEKFFGDEYRQYKATTPEFLPFPLKKWFGSDKNRIV